MSSQSSHNVRRIPLTLWLTISDDIGILFTIPSHFGKYFSRKKEFFRKENSSLEKTSWKRQFWSDFKKIYIFEMRMKNWIEWTNKISKIWEKIWTRTYFKFLHIVSRLWEDCEWQSRGKSKWSWKTSHNVSGIQLTMWGTNLNEDAYYQNVDQSCCEPLWGRFQDGWQYFQSSICCQD